MPGPVKRLRRWLVLPVALVSATVLVVLGCFGWIRLRTSGESYPVAGVPPAPVVLVLGSGLIDGQPSPYLAARLETADALFKAGKAPSLLVSGDESSASDAEVDVMRDWLVARGVPANRVVTDYSGFDTYASCTRAVTVFGVRDAIIVSQAFHLPRALYLCHGAGMHAVGVAATDPSGSALRTVRELPAAVKAVAQDLFHPSG